MAPSVNAPVVKAHAGSSSSSSQPPPAPAAATIYLVDLVAAGQQAATIMAQLAHVLQDPDVTKVLHDCRLVSSAGQCQGTSGWGRLCWPQ